MEEDDKPFECSFVGCKMRFTNEDHLTVHKKKHDMILNLDNGQKTNAFVADQTPTPTRFIRNCEEVGLFQDLQNVNPFEETFRKAVEAARTGAGPLHEVDCLSVHTGTDDSLHTPHVFPHIIEDSTSNSSTTYKPETNPVISSTSVIIDAAGKKSSVNNASSTSLSERPELDHLLRPTSTTGDENCATEVITTSILDRKVNINCNGKVVGIENTKVVRQEADTSQHRVVVTHGATRQIIISSTGDKHGVSSESPAAVSPGASTVQLLLRMPDGKLLQLSALPVEQVIPSENNIAVQPPQVEPQPQPTQNTAIVLTTQPSSISLAESEIKKNGSVSTVVTAKQSNSLSLAKLKLKQTLTKTHRPSTENRDTPAKVPKPKNTPTEQKKVVHTTKTVNNSSGKQAATSSNNIEDPCEKRQKFLARNRVAAMRCREKRKTWIKALERRAEDMQRTNHHLQTEVAALRAEVASLKTLLLAHKDCPVTQAMAQGSSVKVPEVTQVPQIINVTLPIATPTHPTTAQPSTASQNLILVNETSSLKRGSSEPTLSPAKKILSVNSSSPIIRQALLLPTTQTNFHVINSTPVKAIASTKTGSLATANVNIAPVPTVHSGVLVTIPVPSNPLSSLSAVIQNSSYSQTITPALASIDGQSAVNDSNSLGKHSECDISSHVIKVNPNAMHKPLGDNSSVKMESDGDSDIEIISDAHIVKR